MWCCVSLWSLCLWTGLCSGALPARGPALPVSLTGTDRPWPVIEPCTLTLTCTLRGRRCVVTGPGFPEFCHPGGPCSVSELTRVLPLKWADVCVCVGGCGCGCACACFCFFSAGHCGGCFAVELPMHYLLAEQWHEKNNTLFYRLGWVENELFLPA